MSSAPSTTAAWPQSTVLTRLDVSKPDEDVARERARNAEAQGLQVVNNGGYSSPPSSTQKRQDFSNEKRSARETKLDDYILGKTLGEGEFGKVKLGWKRGNNVQVAVKIIRKEKIKHDKARIEKVFREVYILEGLDHPNIVRLHELVETENTYGIVLEYAPCGELFNFILNQRYLKDHHAKRLFAQLVSAVGYLHRKGIIHRDLKLENLLLDRNQNIIVTDFGFANRFNPLDELPEHVEAGLSDRRFVKEHQLDKQSKNGMRRGDLMATSCGSPCYAAPELVISDGLYTGRKVDVWSIGVILYAMLAGYLPYDDDPRNPDGDNINLLYSYITETTLKFPDYVSAHARDLLKRILIPNPRQRADLFEVARHSWLIGYENVVEAITSPNAMAEGQGSVTTDGQGVPGLARSASARVASNPTANSAAGGLINKHGNVGETSETERSKQTPRESKRQTVQVEYVPPRDSPSLASNVAARREDSAKRARYATETDSSMKPAPPPKTSMPPPTRPYREVPRSVTDPALGQASTARPGTQGSTSGVSRLPSRGSYGQPVAAQVATTSAQGRFSQPPRPPGSAPYGSTMQSHDQPMMQTTPQYRGGEAEKQQQRVTSAEAPKHKRGHSRSQTLSDLTSRVFGRSNSQKKTQERRPKPDRSHPPTSMKPVDSPTSASRKSTDSRRSFGIGRKSTDFNSGNTKRSSRRFSFLPPKWGSSKPDLNTTPPQTASGPAASEPYRPQAYSPSVDGAQEARQPAQYSTKAYPPVSYQQHQPYTYSTPDPTFRAASAGNTMPSQPPWPLGYQPGFEGSEAPSRFDSPAMSYQPREKQAWQSESWSSGKKMQRGGPAQRVMDFFRGRRHDRSGMA